MERCVSEKIRDGAFLDRLPPLPINDVLGVKVVCEEGDIARVGEYLENRADCSIVERKVHQGLYKANHLIVRYHWPRGVVLAHPPQGRAAEVFRERGCSCDVEAAFREFVMNAEEDVTVEVALASYEDMLESEIGRSMHEDHILAQRNDPQYQGHLARNIEHLMDYLFRYCMASGNLPEAEVPILLWGRYMPDYIDRLHQRLCGSSAEMDFTEACLCAEERQGK